MSTPQAPMSEEEARALIEKAQAKLQKQMARAHTQLGQFKDELQGRIAQVESELAEYRALRDQLAPHAQHPAGAYHHTSILALCQSREAYLTMLQMEASCAQFNQNLAQSGPAEDWDGEGSPFRDPETQPRYLEARARMDYFLTGFLWMRHLEAADALLRLGGADGAITPANDEERAHREARRAALQAQMSVDPSLAQLVQRLSDELQLVAALLPWAKTSLARVAQLEGPEKRALLQDPDWLKLSAAQATLGNLPQALESHPALMDFDFTYRPAPVAAPELDSSADPVV